jgi:hypothetical protein
VTDEDKCTPAARRGESVLELAGRLLARQPGSVARVLAEHRERPDGCCSRCGPTSGVWPCFTVSAAREAERLASRTSAGVVVPITAPAEHHHPSLKGLR